MHELVDAIAQSLPPDIAKYWWSLGKKGPEYLLYGQLAIALLLWGWAMYRGIRWALGHKKALGRWWKPAEYKQLIQHLYDEHRKGRVLAHAEIALLRKHTEGDNRVISDQGTYL